MVSIQPLTENNRDWVQRHITDMWGAEIVVSRGKVYRPADLPGFVAYRDSDKTSDEIAGLITYHIANNDCEIVTIDSMVQSHGIGTALIEAVQQVAVEAQCKRLWLITTNDNIEALRFYQRRGFALAALHVNAIAQSRQLKPQIPLIGLHDIPIRDEIELEILLA